MWLLGGSSHVHRFCGLVHPGDKSMGFLCKSSTEITRVRTNPQKRFVGWTTKYEFLNVLFFCLTKFSLVYLGIRDAKLNIIESWAPHLITSWMCNLRIKKSSKAFNVSFSNFSSDSPKLKRISRIMETVMIVFPLFYHDHGLISFSSYSILIMEYPLPWSPQTGICQFIEGKVRCVADECQYS